MISPRKKMVRRARGIALSLVWLTLVWVLLWGDWGVGTLAAGLLVALVVVVVSLLIDLINAAIDPRVRY